MNQYKLEQQINAMETKLNESLKNVSLLQLELQLMKVFVDEIKVELMKNTEDHIEDHICIGEPPF